MKRYILPTIDWSSLLPIIVRDAQPGAVKAPLSIIQLLTAKLLFLVRRRLTEIMQ